MAELTFDRFTFDDTETIRTYLSKRSGIPNIDLDDVVDFIQNEEGTIFFIDSTLTGCEEKDSVYAWLDTGFVDTKKHPIFISCINRKGFFSGHIVGDAELLSYTVANHFHIRDNVRRERCNRFQQKYERKTANRKGITLNETYSKNPNPKVSGTKDEPREIIDNTPSTDLVKKYWNNKQVLDITKDVASLLIINKWHSIEGLDRYLKVIGARLAQLVKAGKSQFFVLNKIKSAICNTGLLNNFGEDVYILYRMNLSYQFYTPYKIIMDKTQYLDEGFTKEPTAIKLEPITFFDSENHGFNVKLEDINFNQHDWLHIIQERRARFPEDLRQAPDLSLIGQIRQSLEIGLKLQKRDGSYAKPLYSASTGSVSWVLPFFANGNFMAAPELVMVIAKFGEFYQLKTILPYDDEVKDKLMDMSIYSRMW